MDYKKIGFKAGLEIHQQLDSGKLFCSCPGYLRTESPHFLIKRKLHAVAGETGEVDVAVAHEASLKKQFIYECYKENVCLVDLDEEPPHLINETALNEALKISLLLNCEIYPITQIMRKNVIDGSNTSGFQRTLLIAHEGFLETPSGKVKIDTIALEEDSARIISKKDNESTYRLDRLGIPLIEIMTSPDMKNPEQVKETALKIGEILRACKVKRGIGTIRQDVNISIKGHDRVEIKGFQDPKMMVQTINEEIERQLNELKENKTKGEVRNALENGKSSFLRPMPGKERMYPETDLPLLKIGREKINSLKKILPKLKTEIRDELKNKGLNEELITLILDDYLDEFETLMRVYDKNAPLIAKMISLWRQDLAKKHDISPEKAKEILNERVFEEILEKIIKKEIKEDDIKDIMSSILQGKTLKETLKIEKKTDDELEEELNNLIKEKPGLRENAYMGLLMVKHKGKIDAKKAMELIKKLTS